MAPSGIDVEAAAKLILEGKLVAIPTETVYGLAGNALDERAALAIFQAKERPFFDPLIIHLPSVEKVNKYASFPDPRLKKLAETFWPGPLTLLLPKEHVVPDIVTSGLPQVAVRVPRHPLTLSLLKKVAVPLAAPSANPFGYVSPTEAAHVEKQLGKKISYILDGGPSQVGIESTIVGVEENEVCIYRLGGLAIEDIEQTIGKVDMKINSSSDPKTPGQLKNHYAPIKPLFLGDAKELISRYPDRKTDLISFGDKSYEAKGLRQMYLSKNSDLNEAALNLFKMLRLADDSDSEIVICERLPDIGLGRAINDRLRRASATTG
jgi:L-threonylcarbamoyladenylate synthase